MFRLKLFVRDFLEAEAVIPLVKDGFEEVHLECFLRVLFPEVFHRVDRTLWQVALPFDTLVSFIANFVELLGAKNLVKFHTFDDGDFLALANVQLKGII